MPTSRPLSISQPLKTIQAQGLYPVETTPRSRKWSRIYGRVCFYYAAIRVLMIYIDLIQHLAERPLNVEHVMENLEGGSQCVVLVAKAGYILFYETEMRTLINIVRKLEDLVEADLMRGRGKMADERRRLVRDVNEAYRRSITVHFRVFMILVAMICIAYASRPLPYFLTEHPANETLVPPKSYPDWQPWDTISSPNYELAFFAQILACFAFGGYLCTHTVFAISLMIFAEGQLKILQINMKFRQERAVIGQMGAAQGPKVFRWKDGAEEMDLSEESIGFVDLIRTHVDIVFFVNYLNKWLRQQMFMDFITYFIATCCLYYKLIDATSFNMDVGVAVGNLIGVFTYNCFYYWHATLTTYESLRLSNYMYESNWLTSIGQDDCKLFQIMQSYTQKPLVYTIGRFVAMSPHVFLVILSKTFSSLTLLHQLHNQNRG